MNGFITKLSSVGDKMLYSTYIGNAGDGSLQSIALDNTGSIYVMGHFPTDGFLVRNAIQSTFADGPQDYVLAKLTPSGGSIVYATYFGSSGS